MTRFTTIADVIDQHISPALGDVATDFDMDAIAHEATTYVVDTREDGTEILGTAGFEVTVTDDEFWTIVAKHDITN